MRRWKPITLFLAGLILLITILGAFSVYNRLFTFNWRVKTETEMSQTYSIGKSSPTTYQLDIVTNKQVRDKMWYEFYPPNYHTLSRKLVVLRNGHDIGSVDVSIPDFSVEQIVDNEASTSFIHFNNNFNHSITKYELVVDKQNQLAFKTDLIQLTPEMYAAERNQITKMDLFEWRGSSAFMITYSGGSTVLWLRTQNGGFQQIDLQQLMKDQLSLELKENERLLITVIRAKNYVPFNDTASLLVGIYDSEYGDASIQYECDLNWYQAQLMTYTRIK